MFPWFVRFGLPVRDLDFKVLRTNGVGFEIQQKTGQNFNFLISIGAASVDRLRCSTL
jgi:hypothetical protein